MKKIYSILIVALATMLGFSAQAGAPQWEIVAGMNVANLDASGASSRIGFHAGVRSTFGIPSADHGFYVNAAAMLSLKGCKGGGITLNPYYLDIPVHMFGDGGFKRFDFGLGLRAGLEFNQKVPVSIGYDFGVLDVADDVSAKTRNLTISVGYKF